jgi:hypothetical protein
MGLSHIFRDTFIEECFSKKIWRELLTKEKDKETLYENKQENDDAVEYTD